MWMHLFCSRPSPFSRLQGHDIQLFGGCQEKNAVGGKENQIVSQERVLNTLLIAARSLIRYFESSGLIGWSARI